MSCLPLRSALAGIHHGCGSESSIEAAPCTCKGCPFRPISRCPAASGRGQRRLLALPKHGQRAPLPLSPLLRGELRTLGLFSTMARVRLSAGPAVKQKRKANRQCRFYEHVFLGAPGCLGPAGRDAERSNQVRHREIQRRQGEQGRAWGPRSTDLPHRKTVQGRLFGCSTSMRRRRRSPRWSGQTSINEDVIRFMTIPRRHTRGSGHRR